MNDPYRWEDQPAEKRVDFGPLDDEAQRDTPVPWRTRDALVAAAMCGAIVALFMPQTWVLVARVVVALFPGITWSES